MKHITTNRLKLIERLLREIKQELEPPERITNREQKYFSDEVLNKSILLLRLTDEGTLLSISYYLLKEVKLEIACRISYYKVMTKRKLYKALMKNIEILID